MFRLFRREVVEEPELTQEQTRKIEEEIATEEVTRAIDVINHNMKKLPYGIRPWMDWSDTPPRLKLKRRRYDRDDIIHG